MNSCKHSSIIWITKYNRNSSSSSSSSSSSRYDDTVLGNLLWNITICLIVVIREEYSKNSDIILGIKVVVVISVGVGVVVGVVGVVVVVGVAVVGFNDA